MQLQDFNCFNNGVVQRTLTTADATLLAPVTIQKKYKRKALLLFHGFSSSPAVFRVLIPSLKNHYDGLFAPCLPGHGTDLLDFATLKKQDLLDFASQTYCRIKNEYEQVDVLGLSLGGLLAHYVNTQFPLSHLFLLAPAFDLNLNISFNLSLTTILHTLGFQFLRSAAGNLYTNQACEIAYRQLPLTTIQEILTLISNYQFTLPNCSTTLFLGKYDSVVDSMAIEKRFENALSVTVHWLNQSAHVLPLDGDTKLIKQIMIARPE